ncbi:MAG: hypothetical protein ACTSWR_05715 [Candidatus Helarchaeota archaeon]
MLDRCNYNCDNCEKSPFRRSAFSMVEVLYRNDPYIIKATNYLNKKFGINKPPRYWACQMQKGKIPRSPW